MQGERAIDERVVYWTRDERRMNFGDFLTEYLLTKLAVAPIVGADLFHLIGSVIDPDIIRRELMRLPAGGQRIAFWCCGARTAQPIERSLLERCEFYGVRGPHTLDVLGLDTDTPMGDPALLLPLLYRPAPSVRTNGKTVCIPHFSERTDGEALQRKAGADVLVMPDISSTEDLERLIDDIASADLVLSGSLHGAILACVYRRPFAFWDTGFVDIPFKWGDFARSVGLDCEFFDSVPAARRFYQRVQARIRIPDLAPILGCCPFAVRPSVLVRALVHDAALEPRAAEALASRAERLFFDGPDNIAALEERERRSRARARGRRIEDFQASLTGLGLGLGSFGRKLQKLADEVVHCSQAVSRPLGPEQPELRFSQGSAGTAFLSDGWTDPNDIAPWSLAPFARMMLPAGLGWEKAAAVVFSGLLFVPAQPSGSARRKLRIWGNDTLLLDQTAENMSDQDTVYLTVTVVLSERIRKASEHLVLTFAAESLAGAVHVSPGQQASIGFAPMAARFLFDHEAP